jgi:hypothetical protein
MELFFLAKSRIFECAFPGGKGSTVAPMQQPLFMQKFQVFTDGDLRRVKLPGKIGDQHPTFAVYQLYNCASAFFVEHKLSLILESGLAPGFDFYFTL